jgi:DNA modification methylase
VTKKKKGSNSSGKGAGVAPAPDLSHITPELRALARPIEGLLPDPANARVHPERNLTALRASLANFTQRKNVVVQVRKDGTRVVRAGNGTLEAAKILGWTHLAWAEVEEDDVQATAFAIADNRTAELAEWEDDTLARLLDGLKKEGYEALDQLGFDERELAELLADLEEVPEGEDPGAEEPPADDDAVSKPGEVYELGPHRLMCGDSTSEEDVALLMNGEKARLMATDPPYLVNYQGGNHPQSSVNKPEVKDKHWDDYIDPESSVAFFADFLRIGLSHCEENVAVYQWHATKRQRLVEDAWDQCGLLFHQTIIWVKSRAVLTRSHFMWQHEPCFYGWVQGSPPLRRPPPDSKTIWEIDQKGSSDGIHPTQKPLEICLRPIRWHLLPGELCYEPFGGSGTCLIAAAMEGRRCFAMEKSPGFCDVIRKRWGGYARSAGIEPGSGAL